MLEVLATIVMGGLGGASIGLVVVSTVSLFRTRADMKNTTKKYAELTLSQENGRLSLSAEIRAEIEETPEWWQAKYDALLMDVDPEAYAKEHAPDPNRKSWNKYSTAYLLGACDDMHEWMSTNTQALATNDSVTCSRCRGVFYVTAIKQKRGPLQRSWNKYSDMYIVSACDRAHEWIQQTEHRMLAGDQLTCDCGECSGVHMVQGVDTRFGSKSVKYQKRDLAALRTQDLKDEAEKLRANAEQKSWESIESLNKKMSLPSYESLNATLEQLSKPIVLSEPEPLNRERTITEAKEFYKRRIGRSPGYPLYVSTKHGEMLIKFHDAEVQIHFNGSKTLTTKTDVWFESYTGTWSHQTKSVWPYSHGTVKSYKQGCACMECTHAYEWGKKTGNYSYRAF